MSGVIILCILFLFWICFMLFWAYSIILWSKLDYCQYWAELSSYASCFCYRSVLFCFEHTLLSFGLSWTIEQSYSTKAVELPTTPSTNSVPPEIIFNNKNKWIHALNPYKEDFNHQNDTFPVSNAYNLSLTISQGPLCFSPWIRTYRFVILTLNIWLLRKVDFLQGQSGQQHLQ